ncbi:MAG: decaprenylphospho-beta-D-ribofuranose 2-oxidase [Gammaproteobacteria bacterium]|jgi:decaprenylphospho-beta-D-ribofuranose 2-oxidase
MTGISHPSREYVEAWGMSHGSDARVLRPRSVEGVQAALLEASRASLPIALRGTGNSYGDASCAATADESLVLDCRAMNRVLSFDASTGVAVCEGGVTIEDLWKTSLPKGYWPRVVSGTMRPTLAGALAMNIHGKNAYRVGTIGEAVRSMDLVLASGDLVHASRIENSDLFHAAIGGFGSLGVITKVEIETTRVHSGELEVSACASRNLAEMMGWIEAHRESMDYLVGWIDCFARGDSQGRGLIHAARYLEEGEDENPELTSRLENQELPSTILGLFPKSELWRGLRLVNHDLGMRFINAAKVVAGRLEGMRPPMRQSHAAFAFLLDFVPNWKWAYGRRPGYGLIQHQIFVPAQRAEETFGAVIEQSQDAGHVPYLGVLKRHRPDPFLLTHGLDGWSLALDFKVTPDNRVALWRHCQGLTARVLDAGGNFYFAKDSVIEPDTVQRMFGSEKLERFFALKEEFDPGGRLASDLWRRLFAPLVG